MVTKGTKKSFGRKGGKSRPKAKQYKMTYVQGHTGIGLPQTKYVTLTYCETIGIANGTGAPSIYAYRLNSIYDPNYTGTGHQPLGHDEWAQLYTKYEVLSSKIKTRFYWSQSLTGGGAGQAHHVGITFDTEPAIQSVPTTRQEKLKSHAKLLLGDLSQVVNCSESFNAKAWDSDPAVNIPVDMSANATVPAYANVWIQSVDGNSSEFGVYIDVRIEYKVRLCEPIELVGS